jgi:uncharacterized membrane protein YidH (DUF202 family)
MKVNLRVLIGLLLVVAGILAVVYGGFSYTTETHSADLGPIELKVEQQKTVNIPLWAGVGSILVGLVTLSLGRDRWPPRRETS